MTRQQLKKANDLEQEVSLMELIENELRNAAKNKHTVKLVDFVGSRGFLIGNRFVIEKMIEAGIYAAMTVRAVAENDLEKL